MRGGATIDLEKNAYYSDGFTLYYIENVGPSGKLVDIENCFTGERKTRDVRELPNLERVEPAENVALSRHLAD